MANHVPGQAAGGAVRGGVFGGALGAVGTFTAVVGFAALLGAAAIAAVATPFIAWTGTVSLAALATPAMVGAGIGALAGVVPALPLAAGGAWFGAAAGGALGATGGAGKGQAQNVQEQARSAYISGYAQTRAGLDSQMAMAAQAQMPQVFDADAIYHPAMAANQNDAPSLTVSAKDARHMGKQQEAAQTVGKA